uniref:Uncharacterized protein n=1 Tax=Helianthus annuus TaxID=4232 RepID=A0A251SWP1_HELAN
MDKRFILRLGLMINCSCWYHPDFNENSQVGELFKGICRLLYEQVCASQQLQGGACFVHQVSLSLSLIICVFGFRRNVTILMKFDIVDDRNDVCIVIV